MLRKNKIKKVTGNFDATSRREFFLLLRKVKLAHDERFENFEKTNMIEGLFNS